MTLQTRLVSTLVNLSSPGPPNLRICKRELAEVEHVPQRFKHLVQVGSFRQRKRCTPDANVVRDAQTSIGHRAFHARANLVDLVITQMAYRDDYSHRDERRVGK